MRLKLVVLIAAAIQVTGCSVTQKISPVSSQVVERVCIVRNTLVFREFLRIVSEQVQENGYDVTVVESQAAAKACPVWATYVAQRGEGWGMYLALADIRVYDNSGLIGQASYKVSRGALEKHGWVEPKIREIATQLFPLRSR